MSTVNAGIKQRILAAVRLKIADKSEAYICHALDKITEEDHRRAVQEACAYLKHRVLDCIAPFKTVGDWLIAEQPGVISMDDVLAARLALIDKIERELIVVKNDKTTATTSRH